MEEQQGRSFTHGGGGDLTGSEKGASQVGGS